MQKKPNILFHGNCQSMAFAKALSHNNKINVFATPYLWEITNEKVNEVRNYAKMADLIISMPISQTYKEGLGTHDLMQISQCPFVLHSNAHFEGWYPTFDFCRDMHGKQISIGNMGNPTGGYLCYLTYVFFYLGVNLENTIKLLQREIFIETISELYDFHEKTFFDRESKFSEEYEASHKSCYLTMWDLLGDRKSISKCFHTFNHPKKKLLLILLHRILAKAEKDYVKDLPWIKELEIAEDKLQIESINLPIYPFVAKSGVQLFICKSFQDGFGG